MADEPDHVSLAAITEARAALTPDIRLTPVWPLTVPAPGLDVPLLLKCENLQLTGSFKVRGALNFVRQLDAPSASRGLIAMSAGNHAQGVALAGAARGIPVTVVMPESAPLAKINATRLLGARVVIHGASLDDARAEAQAIAAREGNIVVPPFDDDAVIAGQGTLGLEVLDQVPDLSEALVPAGGGGLLAGVATAIKTLRPDIRVVGVQSAAMDGIRRSFAAGRVLTTPPARTIADGVAVAGPPNAPSRSSSATSTKSSLSPMTRSRTPSSSSSSAQSWSSKALERWRSRLSSPASTARAARPSPSSPEATSTSTCSARSSAVASSTRAATSTWRSRSAIPPASSPSSPRSSPVRAAISWRSTTTAKRPGCRSGSPCSNS